MSPHGGEECLMCGAAASGPGAAYGLCQACNNVLAPLPDDEIGEAWQEALLEAFDIELGGAAFYGEGAGAASDSVMRTLLERLAALEREHTRRLCWRYRVRPPALQAGASRLARVIVYGNTEIPASGPADLIRLAMVLERRARDYYVERRDEADVGSPEREVYSHLVAEGGKHIKELRMELGRSASRAG